MKFYSTMYLFRSYQETVKCRDYDKCHLSTLSTDIQTCRQTYIRTDIHTYRHTYVQTNIQTCTLRSFSRCRTCRTARTSLLSKLYRGRLTARIKVHNSDNSLLVLLSSPRNHQDAVMDPLGAPHSALLGCEII